VKHSYLLGVALVAATAAAQGPPPKLDPMVTTAERTPGVLSSSVAAVTRLSRDEIARIPQATFADVLRTVPGFSVVDFDGLGFDPQLVTRGFYGGGEAEYVVVLLDGKPLNQLHTGRALFEALPSGVQIEAIEIVRGGASALYGDAAIGGVINIITRQGTLGAPGSRSSIELSGGSFGLRQGALEYGLQRDGRTATLSATFADMTGYRRQAGRTSGSLRLRVVPVENDRGHLAFGYLRQMRDVTDPGPLTEAAADDDRRSRDILFRFDETSDTHDELAVDGARQLTYGSRLTWFATAGWRDLASVRTVALAPGFGDTQARDTDLQRLLGNVQYALTFGRHDLLVGVELQRGTAESRYYAVAGGPAPAYAESSGDRGALNGGADADRTALSAYTQFAVRMSPRLRLSIGGRFDRFSDDMSPRGPDGGAAVDATNEAFSPKIGLNIELRDGGTAYVTAGRSFKAATLDQLFDQRAFPVPFPPFAVRSSNVSLRPATGVNIEAGTYQNFLLGERAVAGLSVSVYDMAMRDEIDFDVATLRYGNIARSRHQGAEIGLRLAGPHAITYATSYTLQAATLDGGPNDGNQIKAIPRHTLSGTLSIAPLPWIETGLVVTRTGEAYFDDANSRQIPSWTRADARIGVRLSSAAITAEVRNVFGAKYVSTGYLDPAGTGTAYVYPAAGAVVVLGVRWSR
jgi:outer membrane receptor protein involved in Fe transport